MFDVPADPYPLYPHSRRVDPDAPMTYYDLFRDRLPHLKRLYGFSDASRYAYLSQLKKDIEAHQGDEPLKPLKTRPWGLLSTLLKPHEVPPWWPLYAPRPPVKGQRANTDPVMRRRAVSFGSTTKLHPSIVPTIRMVREDNDATLDAMVNLQWVDPNHKQPILAYDGTEDSPSPVALLSGSQATKLISYFYPYKSVIPGDWLLPSRFNGRNPLTVQTLRSALRKG